jgi:hypothetical protein
VLAAGAPVLAASSQRISKRSTTMTRKPRLFRIGAAKALTQAMLLTGSLESKVLTDRWGF